METEPGSVTVLRAELTALRREMELQSLAQEKALELQAVEIARRLEALNGEAGRLREMQAQFVPRETWDAGAREHRLAAEAALKLAAEVARNRSDIERISSGLTWLTRLVVGAIVTAAISGALVMLLQALGHARP